MSTRLTFTAMARVKAIMKKGYAHNSNFPVKVILNMPHRFLKLTGPLQILQFLKISRKLPGRNSNQGILADLSVQDYVQIQQGNGKL